MSTGPGEALPTGTVTFLRTDVEGSMRLAQLLGPAWDDLSARHLELVRRAVSERGGVVVRTEGDAVFAAFRHAGAAVRAALAVQRALATQPGPPEGRVRVRIGLHSGDAHLAGDDYGGLAVSLVARVVAVGHGGQTVLSAATRSLVEDDLDDGVSIRSLGRHRLRGLSRPQELFQLEAEGLDAQFPPLRTQTGPGASLPASLTSVVGREGDLARLAELMASSRVLTITGTGGVGKTTLALELARSVAEGERADVVWVPLAGIADPALVPAAVARELGVRDAGDRPALEGVSHLLAGRPTLLVLDNVEHVLDAAPALADLVRATPGLSVLATSRAPLRVAGEQVYPLRPLDPDGSAALRLFEDRARAVVPGWAAGGQVAVVREICRLLDGLPLGIELAASRVALLPPAVLRDRLAANLPLQAGAGRRDVPERQRTLHGAVRWSYDLLDEPSRRLLRVLAVFEHGFDLEQASAVAAGPGPGDVLDGLDTLATSSLLVPEPSLTGAEAPLGGARFRLLETVRAFALARLDEAGELAAARTRHAEAYLVLARSAAAHLSGPSAARWLDRLALDHENLHAAVAWATQTRAVETAQRLVEALWRYWQTCGHLREGRELAEGALALPGAGPERLGALEAVGGLAYWQGDPARAEALYREQLALARELGERRWEAAAALNVRSLLDETTGADEIGDLVRLARRLYEEVGDELGQARATFYEQAAQPLPPEVGDEPVARVLALAERFAALGDTRYEGLATATVALQLWLWGRWAEAARWAAAALRIAHRRRDQAESVVALPVSATLLVELGRSEDAAILLSAWERTRDVQGYDMPGFVQWMLAGTRPQERARAALGPVAFDAATGRGAAMTLDEAVEHALLALERAGAGDDRAGEV